ncbi:CLUMA_CG008990, isoform A [Clunio marinus]|uniref:CLUMA_CG008990, isoform A n=1 Tax=Clunio marinus TaxID=568069 RepID=A0A1J1IAR0_9DIPT|nr:CLUMA_CG008990, isoform A [Clunio marinus]
MEMLISDIVKKENVCEFFSLFIQQIEISECGKQAILNRNDFIQTDHDFCNALKKWYSTEKSSHFFRTMGHLALR